MKDWIVQIDAFLTMARNEVLNSAGKVSQIEAQAKAEKEYELYRKKSFDELSPVEQNFLTSLKSTQRALDGKE